MNLDFQISQRKLSIPTFMDREKGIKRDRTKKVNRINATMKVILGGCAFLTILTTLGIILTLVTNAKGFFEKISLWDFLTGTEWTPLFADPSFGVLPLLVGTLTTSIVALAIAIPLGLGSAIYLSEYAPSKVRSFLKPTLELLAGIPSIIYGFFALTYITPLLSKVFSSIEIFNALSAGIAIGVMTIPLISSLSEDALSSVSDSLRHGAYALGATKMEVSLGVVLKGAFSGIVASIVLAMSRAVGETMIVTIAAGAKPSIAFNPLESVQTMTAFIVQASQGDNPHGTTGFYSLYAVGLALFVLTLVFNIFAQYIANKHRRRLQG